MATSDGAAVMRTVAWKTGAGVLLMLVVTLAAQLAGSEPVRKKLLDELDVERSEGMTTIRITLTSPVRYIRHFPYDCGDELRIRIMLFDVSSDNREALTGRESLVPPGNGGLPLDEVVYEGDIEGGPSLTLFFSRRVEFAVQQGTDSRSIVVHVTDPETQLPGQPSPGPVQQ